MCVVEEVVDDVLERREEAYAQVSAIWSGYVGSEDEKEMEGMYCEIGGKR